MKKSVVLALMLALPLAAQSQNLRAWGKERMQDYSTCSFVGAAALIMGTVGPEEIQKAGACSAEKIEGARVGYQALPPLPAKPAQDAMKDYYAAWVAGMRTLPSLLTQRKDSARSASNATMQRLNELWARVEIEAGL